MTMTSLASPRPARGDRWIPYLFFAFFGIVLAANGTMLWVALGSWTGLATGSAYERGLAYNQTLAAARAQAELGWRAEVSFSQTGPRQGKLQLELADRAGNHLSTATVEAAFIRPTSAGQDHRLALTAGPASGHYEATIELPLAGQWDAYLTARRGADSFRWHQRLYLQP